MKTFILLVLICVQYSRNFSIGLDEPEKSSNISDSEVRHSRCLKCMNRDILENITKLSIKEDILKKLGFQTAPEVVHSNHTLSRHLISKLIKEVERKNLKDEMMSDDPFGFMERYGDVNPYEEEEEEDYYFYAKQITVLSQNADGLLPENILQLGDIIYFPLSTSQLHPNILENIAKAFLNIRLPSALSMEENEAWVKVNYISVDKNQRAFVILETAEKFILKESRHGWAKIDITNLVSMWTKNIIPNLGIRIDVTHRSDLKMNVSKIQRTHTPYLTLEVQNVNNNFRQKRSIRRVCTDRMKPYEDHCCMWGLSIDFFEDFGWDFIIHPTRLQMNYCSGECRLGESLPSTMHAHILQLANIKTCCTPQKFINVTMLYFDEKMNIIKGKLPNVKVAKCGCS